MKQWGMGLAVLGIMFGVTLAVLGDVQNQFDSNSTQYTAVEDTITAISDFTGWFPLVALVIVAGVIITLVSQGFGSRGGSGRMKKRGRA